VKVLKPLSPLANWNIYISFRVVWLLILH